MEIYGDEVEIIGVAGRDGPDAMRGFVDRFGLEAMTNLDGDAVWDDLGVIVQPAWIVVPAAGEPEVIHGSLGLDAIGRIVDDLA